MKTTTRTRQVMFFVIPFLLASAAFPFLVWPALLKIGSTMDDASALVGEPSGVDPAAILAILIYAACTGVFARWLLKRNHRFAMKCVCAVGAVSSVFVFVVVSSLLWL